MTNAARRPVLSALLLLGGARLLAVTITVTNTSDSGAGSLREAIAQSNASAGVLDTIHFNVTGTGCSGSPAVCVIGIAFPAIGAITDPVVIDATTQPSYAGSPLVQIDWTAQTGGNGLNITGGGTTVKGLSITRFSSGIVLDTGDDNTIQGNWLGVDPSGAAAGNGYGVYLTGSTGNLIGGTTAAQRNVISANGSGGVHLENGSSDNVISGNYIGTNPAGTAALGGDIVIVSGSGNTIGGTAAGSGNVIVGGYAGIGLNGAAANTVIQGNLIGTDKTGSVALGNGGGGGILVSGNITGSTIGGVTAGARNVISASSGPGINFQSSSSIGVAIKGNYIGTNAAGAGDLGNGLDGIFVGYATGALDLEIGGPAAGEGNLIAFNGKFAGAGIWNTDSTHVKIRGNSIHSNKNLGIDLGGSRGTTVNDAGDADTGANNLQNFPLITSVSGGDVSGSLNSAASSSFTLDFYASPACGSAGFGEGKTYLGSIVVATDGTGNKTFTANALPVPSGQIVTATATDGAGNTSEFSQCGSLSPVSFDVDSRFLNAAGSDHNDVLEPGETAPVRTTWKNPLTTPLSGNGTASNFTGPPGATYTIADNHAAFPYVSAEGQASCAPDCYSLTVSNPGSRPETRPASHWDVTFVETLDVPLTVPKTWKLHVGDSFTDVPRAQLFYNKIETIFHNGLTVGCTAVTYCPSDKVPRSQMAIFIARGIAKGVALPTSGTALGKPYNCAAGGSSAFVDVAPTAIYCKGVHYVAVQNVTGGCDSTHYCPSPNVTRGEMAIFMAKAIVAPAGGASVPQTYGPDPVTGASYSCNPGAPNLHFTDVAVSDLFCKHVHYLWAKGAISGCAATEYCPTGQVGRDEMAKFLGNAFGLVLYAP